MSNTEHYSSQLEQQPLDIDIAAFTSGIIGQIKELISPLPKEKVSRQSLMRSDLLFKRFLKNPDLYPTDQEKSALLTEDLKHIGWETLLGQTITSWETIIDPQENISQAGNYYEDIGAMSHSFTQMLAQEGKNQTRAEIETKNAHFMKKWALTNADTNHLLVWTSPPDDKNQGYYGTTSKTNWHAQERHHSFFYVMRAETKIITNENQQPKKIVVLKTDQLRAWPNITQIIEIQKQLSAQPNLEAERLLSNDGQATLLLIDNLIELAGSEDYLFDLQSIMEIIYLSQAEWLFTPDQMPEVDQQSFWQQFNDLTTEFYLAEALPLFNQIQLLATQNQNSEFLFSNEYQLILDQLDILFDYWHMALQKWIQDHDQNPQSQVLTIKNLLQKLRTLPLRMKQKLAPEEESKDEIQVNKVSRMFKTDIKKRVFKKSLTPEEKKFYLTNLNLLSLSGSFLSLAQCGVMTPFTLPFTIIRNGLQLGDFSQFTLAIQKIPIETQKKILSQFNQYIPLQLKGSPEQFMVPKSYLGKCYLEGQQIMGPCGIPLTLDPDALPMSEGQFGQLISGFKSLVSKQETNFLQTQLTSKASSGKERRQAQLLTTTLNKAFNKQSLSLTQLLANDTRVTLEAAQLLPTKLLKEVQQSNTSFNQLMTQLAQKLMSAEYQDLLESVPEFKELLKTITDQ